MKVAMFVDNAFVSDWRVIREAEALAELGYSITVYAMEDTRQLPEEKINGITVYRIIPPDFLKVRSQSARKNLLSEVFKYDYDIIHCHDHNMLQAGADYKRVRPGTILIYDSHELFYGWPTNYYDDDSFFVRIKSVLARKYQILKEKRNSRLVDYVITVNDSIAKLLKERFKLNKLPLVLFNTLKKEEIPSGKNDIRKELNIADSITLIVYFGTHLYRSRIGIEIPIKEFANKKDIALLFISANDFAKEYYMNFVKENGIKNIFFKDFISRNEIVPVLSSCDIGLVTTWDKKHLSYWYALDSKIFSYIMSELPILATAQPEYRNIIEQNDIGVCINPDEKEAFMNGLSVILNKYDYYRDNVKAAKQKYNWETERLKLAQLYSEIQFTEH